MKTKIIAKITMKTNVKNYITHRDIFVKMLLNQIEIRLYLPFSN